MHEMEIKYSLYTPISICPLQIDAQESIVFNHDSVHQIQNHQRSHIRNKSTSVAVENGLRIFIFFLVPKAYSKIVQLDLLGVVVVFFYFLYLWRSGTDTFSKIRSVIFCVTKFSYKNCLLESHLPIIMLVL